MSLTVKVLGGLEFCVAGSRLESPVSELLLYLAANPGLRPWSELETIFENARGITFPDSLQDFVIKDATGLRLICSSDLQDYRATS